MVGINSNVSLASSLFGSSNTSIKPDVSDVITGNAGGVSSAVSASFASSLGSSSNLSSFQQSSFSNLENFITENVEDENIQAGLLSDLSAIQNILETGDASASLDPVFSLLAGLSEINEGSIGNISNGFLVDSLF